MICKNKRCILSLVCVALCLGLVGCGSAASSAPAATATPEPTATPLPDDILNQPVTFPDSGEGVDSGMGVTPSDGTVIEPDADLVTMLDAIYAAKPVGLSLDTRAVDLSNPSWMTYYTGLASADKIDAAVASEPMIGSQAYSLVLIRCKDAADSAEVSKEVAENVDPRKWICVIADDGRVVSNGNIVMLAMVEEGLSDVTTADELVTAFTTVVGAPETDVSIVTTAE